MENCCVIYFRGAKICDVTNLGGAIALRPVSTQENKHGIGPDRKKIETAHGLSVPIFCSSLNL